MPVIYVVKHLLCKNCISLGVDDQEFLITLAEGWIPDPGQINRLTRVVEARDLCLECKLNLEKLYQGKVPDYHPILDWIRLKNTWPRGSERNCN